MNTTPKQIASVTVSLALLTASVLHAQTWNQTAAATYNWNDDANWNATPFPNAVGAAASVSADFVGAQTINLNQAITVGSLTVNDSGTGTDSAVTIAAGTAGSLIFQVSTGSASITHSTVNFDTTISANVVVNSNTTINTGPTQFRGVLFSGSISGSGTITKNSSGSASDLKLTGDNSSYTGAWILSAGNSNSRLVLSNDNNLGASNVGITLTNNNTISLNTGVSLGSGRTITIQSGALSLAPGGAFTNTVASKITGAGGVNQTGTGGSTVVLTNDTNDFTGNVSLASNVSITASSIANTGQASALGAGSAISFGNGTFGGGGTLNYTGGTTSSNRQLHLNTTGSGGSITINNNGTGALSLTSTADMITGTQTGGRTVTLGGTNTDGNILSEKINANGTGAVSLVKDGAGTWTVAHATSDYTGTTTIKNGILNAASLNRVSGGTAGSSLGAPVTLANGTIGFGSTTATGQLTYTGTGESTDRVINLAGTTGGAKIDQSGTGLLKFESSLTATGAGIKTLTLQGSTTGTGEIAGVIVDNSGTNKTSVTKTGTGTWTLSGANSYTGATTISDGTLSVNGSLASGSAVTVNSGGTLGGSGTIGGTVTVASGGFLAPGNSPGVLTVGSLTLNTGSTTSMEIVGATTRGTDYDGITITTTNGLTYGGTLSLAFTSTLTNGNTLDLFSFTDSDVGNFTSIVSTGVYAGSWSSGSGVWTFTGNDQLLTFDLASGDLNVAASMIPEPSAFALIGGMLVLVSACVRSRRRA